MEVAEFSDIQEEFMGRIRAAVYCTMATIDRRNRPRSRIMHPIWEESTGWVISWPRSHKAKHIHFNPHVSLAYLPDETRPVYVDCVAEWIHDRREQRRVWDLHGQIPSPVGFDLEPHYGSIEHPYFGVLRLTPWRMELATLGGESRIWRPEPSAPTRFG